MATAWNLLKVSCGTPFRNLTNQISVIAEPVDLQRRNNHGGRRYPRSTSWHGCTWQRAAAGSTASLSGQLALVMDVSYAPTG